MATYTISSEEDWPSHLFEHIQSKYSTEWNTANPPTDDLNPLKSNLPEEDEMVKFLSERGVNSETLKADFKPTVFTVSDKEISYCTLISNLVKIANENSNCSSDQVIYVPSVDNAVLSIVVEYLKEMATCSDEDVQKLKDDPMTIDVELQKTWRNKLNPTNADAFSAYPKYAHNKHVLSLKVVLASNYLDVKPLYEISCRVSAELFKGKSAEEISAMYNIKPSPTTDVTKVTKDSSETATSPTAAAEDKSDSESEEEASDNE